MRSGTERTLFTVPDTAFYDIHSYTVRLTDSNYTQGIPDIQYNVTIYMWLTISLAKTDEESLLYDEVMSRFKTGRTHGVRLKGKEAGFLRTGFTAGFPRRCLREDALELIVLFHFCPRILISSFNMQEDRKQFKTQWIEKLVNIFGALQYNLVIAY